MHGSGSSSSYPSHPSLSSSAAPGSVPGSRSSAFTVGSPGGAAKAVGTGGNSSSWATGAMQVEQGPLQQQHAQ
jgi:hypothetical protein